MNENNQIVNRFLFLNFFFWFYCEIIKWKIFIFLLCDVPKYQLITLTERNEKKRKEMKKRAKINETKQKKKIIWMQNYFYFSSFLFPSLPLIWPFGLSSFNFSFMQIKQSYPFVCVTVHNGFLLVVRACVRIYKFYKRRRGKYHSCTIQINWYQWELPIVFPESFELNSARIWVLWYRMMWKSRVILFSLFLFFFLLVCHPLSLFLFLSSHLYLSLIVSLSHDRCEFLFIIIIWTFSNGLYLRLLNAS